MISNNTSKSSIAYHNSICSNLPSNQSKADIMGIAFVDWFNLYNYIKYVDQNIYTFLNKPYYTLLNETYNVKEPHKHKVYIQYKEKYYEHNMTTKTNEGYLMFFIRNKSFILVKDKYEWDDIKEESDKFRPFISKPYNNSIGF